MTNKLTLKETDKRKENIITHGIVLGIDGITELCKALGNPQDSYRTIHIAGTNGKGTTGLFIQSVLTKCGYKTCRFSSPAVLRRFETMQCNGVDITESEYTECMNEVLDTAEKYAINTTDFECETAAAYLWFKKIHADFAIIECGMGGLLDATNIINHPDICVFTSIGLDHMKFLGNTPQEIAETKCGILRKGCIAVSAENSDVQDVIKSNCKKLDIPVIFVDKNKITTSEESVFGQKINYKNNIIKINLSGTYQAENAALALECLNALKKYKNININYNNIKNGFNSVQKYFGRFYPIHENPLIILDGAHNPNAADKLTESIKKYLVNKKITAIFGAYKDKQYKTVAKKVLPYADRVFTVSTMGHRRLTADKLAEDINNICNAKPCKSYTEALISAIISDCDCILVFGSLSYLHNIKKSADFLFDNKNKKFYKAITHPLFAEYINKIDKQEQNRKFCHHGIDHLIYTAKIFEKLLEEYNIKLNTDFIYTVSFLHDLGRAYDNKNKNNNNHDIASAEIAEKIMKDSGYSDNDILLAKEIISEHSNKNKNKNNNIKSKISKAFALADMYSRNCKTCFAYEECNWDENKKKHTLAYFSDAEERLS